MTAPGAEGEMTILDEHMPLVTTLKAGELIVREKEGSEKRFLVTEGILEVRHDGATVIL